MRNYRIAERYAKVLITQAENESHLENIHADVQHISALLAHSPEMNDFVNNPVIPINRRRAIVEQIFNHKVSPSTYKFLLLIAEKERLNELSRICEVFNRLHDELKNIVRARVSSVCSLRPDQVAAISAKLKHVFNKEITIETSIDGGLLGGFKVQVGDQIYDYSIRTQLEQYREAVMNH